MKKYGTLIMLFAVFILTAAFGKEVRANGVSCNHTNPLGQSTWEYVMSFNATCTEAGYHIFECSICHARKNVANPDAPAYGHNWGKWITVKAATCTASGQKKRTCEECRKTETQSIPATGHKWGGWSLWKPATCEEVGKEGRVCSVCKAIEMRDLKALGHKWSEWKVTMEPSHGTDGEESRTCSTCKKTETRSVAGENAAAKVGDSGIRVVVTQEILKMKGLYGGVCDGVFREDLATAIKAYEKESGLKETGAIYPDTLRLLAKTFWILLDEESPLGEIAVYLFQESGTNVNSLRVYQYSPNYDGTHKVESRIGGFEFLWGKEKAHIYFPDDVTYYLDTYDSPCVVDGNKAVCIDCCADMGNWLIEEVKLNLDALLAELDKSGSGIGISLNILPTELTKYDLPPVSGMSYSLMWNALRWDSFKGALRYDVYLWSIGKDGHDELLVEDCVDDAGGDTNSFEFPMLNGGQYVAALLAKDDSGAVSDHTFLYFGVGDGTMPDPLEVVLKDGCASWAYEYGNLDPVFHVDLIRAYVIDHGLNHESVYEADTENAYMDFTEIYAELAVKGKMQPGDALFVGVMAVDANGEMQDSAMVHSEFVPWTAPNFYRVLCAVNVRRGPGKSFERIGGYSLGDYFVSYGTETGADGTYYVVNYKGQTGYVLSSCAAWFTPKLFSIHVDLGNNVGVDVGTNPDGTINQLDLANKVQKRGYRLAALKQTDGKDKGSELSLHKVLTKDDKFEAVWEPDPDYVIVQFVDEAGKPVKVYDYLSEQGEAADTVPVRIGTTFRIRTNAEKVLGWRWSGNGKDYTEINDATPFTAQMTKLVCYEKKSVTLGKKTVTGRPEELLYLYDAPTDNGGKIEKVNSPLEAIKNLEKLGRLQEGDVLTIQEEIFVSVLIRMYKVHVDRLNKDGYIWAELIDGQNAAESYTIYFNADGGYCPVSYLQAKAQAGYAYPTLRELPVPSRSGYNFVGWETSEGVPVTIGHEFTGNMTVRAKWYKYSAGLEVERGIFISRGERPLDEQTRPYGFETPTSTEKIELPVCEEVRIVGRTGGMYQCLRDDHSVVWVEKRFVATNYEVYFDAETSVGRYFHLQCGDPWYDAYGRIGYVEYQGKTGRLFYIIGERDGYWKVAAPFILLSKGSEPTKYTSGVGWVIMPDYCQTVHCRVTFCPGEGINWLDSVDVPMGQGFGSVSKYPIPCLSGYEFEGWYTDPVLGKRFDANTPVTESLTVYAHYKYLYDDFEAATEDAPIFDRCNSAEGEVLGYVKAGEVVVVQKESKKGLFAWVTHDGVSGWVQTRYLVGGNIMEAKGDRKVDTAIRSKAKYKKGTVYRDVTQNELFLHLGSEGSYYKIAWPCDDGYAFIAKDQLQ